MIRHLSIFAATFAVGVVLAVVIRTAMYHPNAAATAPPMPVSTTTPVSVPASAPAPPSSAAAVNSICAICGMPVNPALGTAEYHGKRIGFGCSTCPAKFAANPDKYGPSALENKVVSE